MSDETKELDHRECNEDACCHTDDCKPISERREANLPPQVIGSVLSEERRSPPEETKKETGPKAGDIQLIANRPCIFNGKTWVDARAVVVDGIAAKLFMVIGEMFPQVSPKELEMIEEATHAVWKKFKKMVRRHGS